MSGTMDESFDPAVPITVIVNPLANQGAAQKTWEILCPLLQRRYPNLKSVLTMRGAHATQLCRDALQNGARMVVAFGGDGTVNEVLNGFVDAQGNNLYPQSIMGILAAGSGSDFQRMFGKLSPHAQLHAFLEAKTRRVDYGIAQYQGEASLRQEKRAFLNIASVGLTGDVLHNLAAQEQSSSSATTRYFKATLKAIFNLRSHPTRVCLDENEADAHRVDLTLASIANGQFFGSGMQISPLSEVDDGLLRVLTASVPTRMRLLALLAKVYKGRHLGANGVRYNSAKTVEMKPVDPTRKVRVELDGEMVGHLPGHFSLRPSALLLRVAGA